MLDGLDQHIVVDGKMPQLTKDGPVEVLVSDELANQLGLQPGEEYTLFARDQLVNETRTTVSILVKVTGIWHPKDKDENFWFIKPQILKDHMLVSEEIFASRVSPLLSKEIYSAFWFIVADGSTVRPDDAMKMVYRIVNLQKQAGVHLNKIRLAVSPMDALYSYQRSANLLTLLLFAFSVPIFGLLLAFITMTAGMTVERQRNEIAVLRSRGAMTLQMVGIATAESLILAPSLWGLGCPFRPGLPWPSATRAVSSTSPRHPGSCSTGVPPPYTLAWVLSPYQLRLA